MTDTGVDETAGTPTADETAARDETVARDEPATRDETALITGASAGIGRALAARFAAGGHDVVLVARREERLRDLAADLEADHGVGTTAIPMDLADRGAAADLHDAVTDRDLAVTTLVNNVGVGTYGEFADAPVEDLLAELQLNVVLLTRLTRLFLPEMVARGHGRVLNLASTAAFQPGPRMAVYYASKAYVLSLSEAVAEEQRGGGVTVTALCPGPVETEFHERAGMDDARLVGWVRQDAETVAEAGYRGAMAGEAVVVPGWRFKLLGLAAKLSPRWLSRKAAAWVNAER